MIHIGLDRKACPGAAAQVDPVLGGTSRHQATGVLEKLETGERVSCPYL